MAFKQEKWKMKRTSDLPRASKEVVLEAAKLNDAEARALVAGYYQAQDLRKATDMQIRHIGDRELSPSLQYTADSFAVIEQQTQRMLAKYAEASPVGRWCLAQHGVGPVITAGLLAHLDIKVAPTVGHFWRFAGRDPSTKWEKGQKRPWNAAVKQLTYHMGECFKRSSNHPDSVYGQLYRCRKEILVERNERGEFAERAKVFVTRSADVRKTLAQGKLPAGNLDSQACNYASKIFLSHLHAVMYWNEFGIAPPKPFAIQHLGHAHEIKIPHLDLFPGLDAAYYGSKRLQAAE
jgi:hypothetical protein